MFHLVTSELLNNFFLQSLAPVAGLSNDAPRLVVCVCVCVVCVLCVCCVCVCRVCVCVCVCVCCVCVCCVCVCCVCVCCVCVCCVCVCCVCCVCVCVCVCVCCVCVCVCVCCVCVCVLCVCMCVDGLNVCLQADEYMCMCGASVCLRLCVSVSLCLFFLHASPHSYFPAFPIQSFVQCSCKCSFVFDWFSFFFSFPSLSFLLTLPQQWLSTTTISSLRSTSPPCSGPSSSQSSCVPQKTPCTHPLNRSSKKGETLSFREPPREPIEGFPASTFFASSLPFLLEWGG